MADADKKRVAARRQRPSRLRRRSRSTTVAIASAEPVGGMLGGVTGARTSKWLHLGSREPPPPPPRRTIPIQVLRRRCRRTDDVHLASLHTPPTRRRDEIPRKLRLTPPIRAVQCRRSNGAPR